MSGRRNLNPLPSLGNEGVFLKPILIPSWGKNWARNLSPYERLHYHQTLSSTRRYVHFKPLPELVINDALDIPLEANYDHGSEHFVEKIDTLLQKVTLGIDNRRRLRNSNDVRTAHDTISSAFEDADRERMATVRPRSDGHGTINKGLKYAVKVGKYNDYHVVHVGGYMPRRHASNIKLMNSSHHSPQTNAGYARQDCDGNVFQY